MIFISTFLLYLFIEQDPPNGVVIIKVNVDEKYRRGREGKKDYKARLEFIEKKLSNPEDIEVKKILKDL